MFFLPTGYRDFGIISPTLHYFVGTMKTGTGEKILWLEKVDGKCDLGMADFLGVGKRPQRTPCITEQIGWRVVPLTKYQCFDSMTLPLTCFTQS